MSSVTYKIYPSIGIARVGTSDEYYLCPQSEGALPTNLDGTSVDAAGFRDSAGRMKRQAAVFQVYAVDNDTGVATPLDMGTVDRLDWTVRLANKKPIWYEFLTDQGEDGYASSHPLRNPSKTGDARQQMIINPGARTVSSTGDSAAEFDRASTPNAEQCFPPTNLKPWGIDTLGGLRMQQDGVLHLLGGHGHSGTDKSDQSLPAYANNDGWFDDTSDGPVTAQLWINDQKVEVEPAWVLVGPPSYAPEVANLVTLFDTIFDVAVRKQKAVPAVFSNGLWNSDFRPSFERDILPILKRGEAYPWVVAIPPKPHRFKMEMLGDPDPNYNGLRRRILNYLRAPDEANLQTNSAGGTMMPYLAGDASIGTNQQRSKYLKLTDTQYFMLSQWADGKFDTGCEEFLNSGQQITRGVLQNCVGGAFSPGIEMTWISRLPQIYSSAFRIRHRQLLSDHGPLDLGWDFDKGMEPGDITKLMAIPWQADFNECSAQPIDGRTLWWWPAQRPLFVYEQVKDVVPAVGDVPEIQIGDIQKMVLEGRIRQRAWVGSDYDMNADNFVSFAENLEMVKHWHNLEFVYNEGTAEDPMMVAVAPGTEPEPGRNDR